MIGYKEAAGCFCAAVAPHQHLSGCNTRGHITKVNPIGHTTPIFYQARTRSKQHQIWLSQVAISIVPTNTSNALQGWHAGSVLLSLLPAQGETSSLTDAEM